MEVITVLFPYILRGLRVTLSVTAVALISGLFFGLVIAILRVYGGEWISKILAAYVAAIRALPHILLIAHHLFYDRAHRRSFSVLGRFALHRDHQQRLSGRNCAGCNPIRTRRTNDGSPFYRHEPTESDLACGPSPGVPACHPTVVQ